jgi:hypothetical protein
MSSPSHDLAVRLKTFLDAGLIRRLPTRWQLLQAEIQMTPYVVSTDATNERAYHGRPFGHPLLRQPLIFSLVGLDHVRTGSGLGARLQSLCTHLHLTYHQGMPVFDLQLIQTHPDGLATLRQQTEDLFTGGTRRARHTLRMASLIMAKPLAYYEQFLGGSGFITRAEDLDYPQPADVGSRFPPEFYSLVGLVNHAASAFPADRDALDWTRVPAHLAHLATRRFRERTGSSGPTSQVA